MSTSFRFPCYLQLLKQLGAADAIRNFATLAVDLLSDELAQNPEPLGWLSRTAKGHGIYLHNYDSESLRVKLAEMFILSVDAEFELFIRRFQEVHSPKMGWKRKDKESLVDCVLRGLSLQFDSSISEERETVQYYHICRNAIAHSNVKDARLQGALKSLRETLGITDPEMPPHLIEEFNYGDYDLYTRAVKSLARVICIAARPSDREIAYMVKSNLGSIRRYKNNKSRFDNAVQQRLQMKYCLEKNETASILKELWESA